MAKTTTTTTEGKNGGEQQTQTARDRYRSRYSAAHPEMNLDDEEEFYSQANANLDELEGYRESNRQLGEAFDRTPLLAGLVLAAKDGENPFTYLAENLGPDMDIREVVDLIKKLFGEVDENGEVVDAGIIGNASKGIVPKEVWEAVLKAQNYDADIASASDKARASALNEKVQNGLRDFGSGLPQSMPTGGAGRGERKKSQGNSLADFGKSLVEDEG